MKLAVIVFLCFAMKPLAFFQAAAQAGNLKKEFPLFVNIEKSSIVNPEADHPEQLAQASAMGMAPPIFVFFRGDIDGENHWVFGCRKENALRESIPCAPVPTGKYRGRWLYMTIRCFKS